MKSRTLISCLSTISFLGLSTITFGQNANSGYTDSLLQQRAYLISANESTTSVDLLLHEAGNNPTCVIHQTDDYNFWFTPYQSLGDGSNQREQKMNLRLKAVYPFLNSIKFSSDFTTVQINCTEKLTTAIINDLVVHFGYNSYEKH
jgi:hypothetical protein